jgi:hypothetical protein
MDKTIVLQFTCDVSHRGVYYKKGKIASFAQEDADILLGKFAKIAEVVKPQAAPNLTPSDETWRETEAAAQEKWQAEQETAPAKAKAPAKVK